MADRKSQLEDRRARNGVLVWFARNPIAANLVFVLLLIGGALSLMRTELEFFPQITPRLVIVQVPFPGASPQEVEDGIAHRIEEAMADIEGIAEIRSTSTDSFGMVVIEGTGWIDMDRLYEDIRRAVEAIDTFPPQAERPVITQVRFQVKVMDLVLYGDVPRRMLREVAEQIRDDLIQSGQISLIEITGLSDYEVSIELDHQTMRRHGLSPAELAGAIRRESLDLPGGTMERTEQDLAVRTLGQARRAEEFAELPVRSLPDGTVQRVRDLAEVRETFQDEELAVRFNGHPAVVLRISRVGGEGAFNVGATVRQYIETNRHALPQGLHMEIFDDLTVLLRSRLGTLLRDGAIGLALILLLLGTFLEPRLALWAAMGLVVSFVGALIVLPLMNVSINMVSLFAFILVVGIVVDDVIIIGENIYTHYREGKTRLQASIDGVREVARPVTMTILSTIIAFLPLMFVAGDAGEILRVVPVVVIATLALSLIHALFILGAQLAGTTRSSHQRRMRRSHGKGEAAMKATERRSDEATKGGSDGIWGAWVSSRPLHRLRQRAGRGLDWLARQPYARAIGVAVAWRYATVAVAVGLLVVTAGYVAGGLIEWRFFPEVDASVMSARVEMAPGTPAWRTAEAVEHLAQVMREVHDERVEAGRPALVRFIQTAVAAQPHAAEIEQLRGEAAEVNPRLGEVVVELVPWARRDLSSYQLARLWRQRVEETERRSDSGQAHIADSEAAAADALVGVRSITFRGTAMDVGRPVDVRWSADRFEDALLAAERLKAALREFQGVHAVRDDHLRGRGEVQIVEVNPLGRSLGLTRREIAEQVRSAYFGIEAQRVQRGRHEVVVMVRHGFNADARPGEREARRPGDDNAYSLVSPSTGRLVVGRESPWIGDLPIVLADATVVPLDHVAEWRMGEGVAEIHRVNRQRVVNVRAEVDWFVANANDINAILREQVLPRIAAEVPGVRWTIAGEQEEQEAALGQLGGGFLVALVAIYGLLAIQFRSFVQPAIIMSAVAFGIIGAIWGHVLMGLYRDLPLSLVSLFGIVAVSGVVVNDSLILIDLINRRRLAGEDLVQALIGACVRRFRPVVLTTVTTFIGLLPLMVGGGQAEVMIPMAVSLAFGVLIGSAITLVLVPALYMIQEDARTVLEPVVGDLAAYE